MKLKAFTSLCLFFIWLGSECRAQFAPAAGQPGTTAMHKDSSAFIGWAVECTVTRGWQNIANTASGYVTAGDSSMALGPAGTGGVVSLGDGGSAICRFSVPIRNGAGFDFAVFENSFSDHFLELAFVEVSTDGINYFRFPATSLRQDTLQADSFDTLGNAEELNNLAGKYRALYGTPFDLEELSSISGLDVSNVNYVKIIDVVGSLDQLYATHDQYGHTINDPWPTEFPTGGFDLDGVGVINNQLNTIGEFTGRSSFALYPNPCNGTLYLGGEECPQTIRITDTNGKVVVFEEENTSRWLNLGKLEKGIYFISLSSGKQFFHMKLAIQ